MWTYFWERNIAKKGTAHLMLCCCLEYVKVQHFTLDFRLIIVYAVSFLELVHVIIVAEIKEYFPVSCHLYNLFLCLSIRKKTRTGAEDAISFCSSTQDSWVAASQSSSAKIFSGSQEVKIRGHVGWKIYKNIFQAAVRMLVEIFIKISFMQLWECWLWLSRWNIYKNILCAALRMWVVVVIVKYL